MGWLNTPSFCGVTKTQIKPNDILTRGALEKLLVAAFEREEFEEKTPFTDVGGAFTPYINARYYERKDGYLIRHLHDYYSW